MTEKLTWRNETRKLRDLVPWDNNAREIDDASAERLEASLEEFGQPQVICIEPDNGLVDGHQRQLVWAASGKFGPDYEVAVRVANRKLTEQEKRKLSVYLHRGAHGDWNLDLLASWGQEADLLDWGFEEWELGGWSTDGVEPLDLDDSLDDTVADYEHYTCPKCGFTFSVER